MWVCKCPPSLWISLILGWISWILEDSYSTSFTGEFRPFPFKITRERDLLNSVILAIFSGWLDDSPDPVLLFAGTLCCTHRVLPVPSFTSSPTGTHLSNSQGQLGINYGFPFYPKAIGYQPEGRKGLEADEAGFRWPCVWTE